MTETIVKDYDGMSLQSLDVNSVSRMTNKTKKSQSDVKLAFVDEGDVLILFTLFNSRFEVKE